MTQKVRKVLIMVVMAALILCLMAASLTYTFTYGRYAGNDFNADDSPYDDLIEFVGSREYTVRTPEELIQAIEDGYSNIQIAVDAEEPFVITEGVTDVSANLVLDLNGKVVVRNSRNPLLDVQTNVSVVLVYDSSKEGQGAFYNPVGSSLQASGGTLTVGSGNYEDGPRAEEYNTDTSQITSATLVTRDARTSTSYGNLQQNVAGLPKISANHYFAEGAATGNFNSTYIKEDTFLIYTLEDDCMIDEGGTLITGVQTSEDGTQTEGKALTVLCNVASCDFYYYYHIGDNPKTTDVTEENTYAVIYGYWDVMALARNDEGMADDLVVDDPEENPSDGLIWPYAAVRMVDGEGFARGGNFKNNFNAVNTYGIYATDGRLAVSQVPVTNDSIRTNFTTGGDGVCIRVSSSAGSTTGGDEGGGTLDISGGSFSSEIGNTIEMQGGTMNVTAGKFTKNGCKEGTGTGQVNNQTALIALGGNGTLEIEGTATGEGENKTYSVTMTAGGTDNGGTLENVFGIRADGGGTVTTAGVRFDIYGDYSAGVLSYDGTINLDDDTFIKVTQSDNNKDENDNTLLTSSAVSSEASSGGDHPITMNGSVQIESNGLGITARGNINVKSGATTTVETPRGTGIYVNGGTFNVESGAEISVESAVQNGYAWGLPPEGVGTSPNIYNGVYVQGGSLTSEGELNVTFTGVESDAPGTGENNSNLNGFNAYRLFQIKSYAVRVEAGTGANTTVKITSGNITNSVGGGVLVNGGTVELGTANDTTGYSANNPTGLTVQTTGTELYYDANSDWISNQLYDAYSDRSNQSNSKSWKYLLSSEGGPAIKIVGGTLKVNGGKYTAQQGDGIVTNGGSSYIYNGVFIGKDSYTILDNDDGISFLKIEGNVTTTSPLAGPAASYAFKVYSGTATVYGGTFGDPSSIASGAFVMGTEDSPGTANIFGGTFDVSDSGDNGGQAGFSAYVYTNVTFTEDGSDENGTGGKITVQGLAAGLTLESAGEGSNNPYQGGSAQVIINSGSFSSMKNNNNSDGIWYGNGSTTLNISGGTFTGANRSGLYFEVNPGNNVQLSGGTYRGAGGAINATSPGNISTEKICWGVDDNGNRISSWLYEDEALNNPITYEVYHLFAENEYYHIGGEYSIDLDGYLSSLTVASSRGQLNQKSSITISTQRSSGDYYQ